MFSKMSLHWDSGWELQNIWQGIEESLRLEKKCKKRKGGTDEKKGDVYGWHAICWEEY